MKKVISILLALTLVMSMGVMAFAETDADAAPLAETTPSFEDLLKAATDAIAAAEKAIADKAPNAETLAAEALKAAQDALKAIKDGEGSADLIAQAEKAVADATAVVDSLKDAVTGDTKVSEVIDTVAGWVATLFGYQKQEVLDLFYEIFGMVDGADLQRVLNQTLEGLKELLTNGGESEVMESLMSQLFAGLDGMGVDMESLIAGLYDIPILGQILSWYIPKTTPTTTTTLPEETEAPTEPPAQPEVEVPVTGSAGAGIAVFAVISVAAAAAFVSSRKKEEV